MSSGREDDEDYYTRDPASSMKRDYESSMAALSRKAAQNAVLVMFGMLAAGLVVSLLWMLWNHPYGRKIFIVIASMAGVFGLLWGGIYLYSRRRVQLEFARKCMTGKK